MRTAVVSLIACGLLFSRVALTADTSSAAVVQCDAPLGNVSVIEVDGYTLDYLWRFRLRSPGPLLRMLIQKSGCFTVLERGAGVQAVMQERQLAARGQLQPGSDMGEGQLVAADYILTPSVIFSNDDSGGFRAGLGDFIGSKWASLTPGVKFKEAQTGLTLVDARTGVQLGASEGTTRKADLSLSGWLVGSGGYSSFEGYGKTSEGKLIAASLVTNFNALISSVKPRLLTAQTNASESRVARASQDRTNNHDFSVGEVVIPKIAGLVLRISPTDSATSIAELAHDAELVVTGIASGDYLPVQTGSLRGWLPALLLRRP